MIGNILTFEIEDKFDSDNPSNEKAIKRSRIIPNLIHLLDFLDQEKAKATFFILGIVSETFPEVVALINSRGHEIASHGMSHNKIASLAPDKLEFELKRSKELLEAVIRKPVLGFRAADDYLNSKYLEIYGHIAGSGYDYDCSFLGRGPRIEINRPFMLTSSENKSIAVIPQSLRRALWFHIRFGEKTRAFPTWFIRSSIDGLNQNGLAAMINMKLWEIDRHHPRPINSDYWDYGTFGNIQFAEEKLRILLENYKFVSCSEYLELNLKKR